MGDVGLGHRFGGDGLFEESAEDEAATARGPAVETEGKLLQIRLQVIGSDRALVGAENPSLEQACDPAVRIMDR